MQLILKLDLEISFNTVEQAAIMESVRSQFGLRAHVRYWEAESRPRSPIFIQDAQGRLTQAPFDSVQGAQQGSVHGAQAHNAAYQACFNEVDAYLQTPGGVLRADCDDCVIIAKPPAAVEAFRRLTAAISGRGGTVQPPKSQAYATAEVKRAMDAAGHTLPRPPHSQGGWTGVLVLTTPGQKPFFIWTR